MTESGTPARRPHAARPGAKPIWFGPDESPLFGWIHQADVAVRAGVVLCPPLGRELASAHRTFRILADELAARGFAALRIDYAGTGDSAGDLHNLSSAVEISQSISSAADYLRQCGARRITLLGMRMGALLAARAASSSTISNSIVLWDPCTSGRMFLREQDALLRLAGDHRSGGSDRAVEGPGMFIPGPVADDLRKLKISDFDPAGLVGSSTEPLAEPPVLLLTRDAAPANEGLQHFLDHPLVHHESTVGQRALIDVASNVSTVPADAVSTVAEYLDRQYADAEAADFASTGIAVSVVGRTAAGVPIRESTVRIGPREIFGLVAEQAAHGASADRPDAPTVIFLNLAVEHHIGPGRAWVDMSRRLAACGYRAVRLDNWGIGDSPWERPLDEVCTYTGDSIRDAADAIDHFRARGDTVIVGLCSGAWAALNAAGRAHASLLYLVNPALWKRRQKPLRRTDIALPADQAATNQASGASVLLRARSWIRRGIPLVGQVNRRVTAITRRILPEPLWILCGRIGWVHAPATLLGPLVRSGVDVRIVLGPRDGSALRGRSAHSWQRLKGPGSIHVDSLDYCDHALLRAHSREAVSDHLVALLAERYPALGSPHASPLTGSACAGS